MEEGLYNKAIRCPACLKEFNVTKVKSKVSKVSSRDSDFCVHYEGINPIFYDAWVCEHCGYAALSDRFESPGQKEIESVRKNISPRWHKRSFSGERSNDLAIEAFKIVLFNHQVSKAKNSDIAKVCIRIAWLYRFKQDGKEKDFLQFALKYYNDTYERENFPIDKLDEATCMYMIAELNRRIGNIDESLKWFSKLISSPQARQNPKILEVAREQYQLAKENRN